MSVEKLLEKIRKMKNPSVVDLSFDPTLFPESVRSRGPSDVEAYQIFSRELMDGLKDIVPAVRLRLGSFALLGAYGMELLRETAQRARSRGYYVLLDVPQSLSARSAEITAQYLMGENPVCPADGLIVDAYAGSDVLKPYVNHLAESGKSLFVVLRSANRSASELQDLLTGSRLVHMAAADIVSGLGNALLTRGGYSQVCGVAAATSADSLKTLRTKYRNLFLLVDGYDQPGADSRKCSYAFDTLGHGAIVCAGEGVTGAWRDNPTRHEKYVTYAVEAAMRMKHNLGRYVTIL